MVKVIYSKDMKGVFFRVIEKEKRFILQFRLKYFLPIWFTKETYYYNNERERKVQRMITYNIIRGL